MMFSLSSELRTKKLNQYYSSTLASLRLRSLHIIYDSIVKCSRHLTSKHLKICSLASFSLSLKQKARILSSARASQLCSTKSSSVKSRSLTYWLTSSYTHLSLRVIQNHFTSWKSWHREVPWQRCVSSFIVCWSIASKITTLTSSTWHSGFHTSFTKVWWRQTRITYLLRIQLRKFSGTIDHYWTSRSTCKLFRISSTI